MSDSNRQGASIIEWGNPSAYVVSFTAAESDIDGLDHVNNACYVKWCEQAAWSHSETLGLDVGDYRRLDRAMAIRHADYDYIYSAYLGDELLVGTWIGAFENIRMKRYFEIKLASTAKTLLKATWNLVCIEISSGKPRRIPDEFLTIYKP